MKLLVLSQPETPRGQRKFLNFTALEWLKTLCFLCCKDFCGSSSYKQLFICFEIALHCKGRVSDHQLYAAHTVVSSCPVPPGENLPKTQPQSQRYLRFLFFCDGAKTNSEGSAGIEVAKNVFCF